MAFSTVEWFALVFAIAVIVKILIVSFNAKGWLNFVKKLYASPILLMLIEVILAAILFSYLLRELTIVQIFAALMLGGLLTGMAFASFAKDSMDWAGKLLRVSAFKRAWFPILIWLILAIWTLVELF